MAGMGDPDYDDENEIVLGSGDKVVVLNWNKEKVMQQFQQVLVVLSNVPSAQFGRDLVKEELDIGILNGLWIKFRT